MKGFESIRGLDGGESVNQRGRPAWRFGVERHKIRGGMISAG